MSLADALLDYRVALAPMVAPHPMYAYAIAPQDTTFGIDPRERAVRASEAVVEAMPAKLDTAEAVAVAGALSSDLAFAIDLLENRPSTVAPPAGSAIDGNLMLLSFPDFEPSKLLRKAVALWDRAMHINAASNDPLADTLVAAIGPAYDNVLHRLAGSFTADLKAYEIDSVGALLRGLESFAPPGLVRVVDRIEAWAMHLISAAIAKLVKLVGAKSVQWLTQQLTDWIARVTDLQKLEEEALDVAFQKDEQVANLRELVASSQDINSTREAAALEAMSTLCGQFAHTLDEIDAAAGLAEKLGRLGAVMGPAAAYVKAVSLSLPALSATVALFLAIDYLDAYGDTDEGRFMDTKGIPTIIRASIG